MKALSNIRYFLFAMLILGSFANYAQNEYGMTIMVWCNLLIGLDLLVETFLLEKEVWKRKKSSTIFIFISVLLVFILVIWNLTGVEVENDMGVILMISLLAMIVFESLAVAIIDRKPALPSFRSYALEAFSAFLLFVFFFMKSMHWAGASPLLLIGSAGLLLLYLSRVFKSFSRDSKNNKYPIGFAILLYLNCALAVVAYAWKNLHWPNGGMFCVVSAAFLLVLLIVMLVNIQMNKGKDKINALSYLKKLRPLTIFTFIFMNYVTVFFAFQVMGIGPKMYSLARPHAFQKMIDKSVGDNDPKIETYSNNMNNFMRNREKSQNK